MNVGEKIPLVFKVNGHAIEPNKVPQEVPTHSQVDFPLQWQVLDSEGCKKPSCTNNKFRRINSNGFESEWAHNRAR